MKKHIFLFASVALAAVGLTSCLPFDDPGTELSINQSTQDMASVTFSSGRADSLDWRLKFVTDEEYDALENTEGYVKRSDVERIIYSENIQTMLGQAKGGQFNLRGGKEGQYPGEHSYQRYYSLFLDNYAEYFCVPHSDFMYGTLKSTYDISSPDFYAGPNSHYSMMREAVVPLLNQPAFDSLPELKACELLVYCQGAQEVADIHGPFPYFEHKANKQNSPFVYNDVRTIYYNIVANLDSIVVCLEHWNDRPEWYQMLVQEQVLNHFWITDMLGMGATLENTFETYRRWANSLKLRMAIHIAKVEPETAKKWAEEAVASGVIEKMEDQILCDPMFLGFSHPLNTIFNSWNDSRLCAFMECLIHSLGHPYATPGYIFDTNGGLMSAQGEELLPGTRITGMYPGITPGLGQSGAGNAMCYYSSINTEGISMCPLYLVKLSEVEFLRAEGAVRGWNMGGSAQQFYEDGIRHGKIDNPTVDIFGKWHFYDDVIDEYLNREQPIPYTYHDPLGNVEDVASPVTVGVKWNDGDTPEVKLEKIITQKYLALFPTSNEAWVDIRRTGYPHVFPVMNTEDGDGSLKFGDIIRRMPFPANDENSLKDIQETGLKALGGPDLQGTRLWWDVEGGNF